VQLVHTGGPRKHQDAFTGDRVEAELGACQNHNRRLCALLQPDPRDAGPGRFVNDGERLLGRNDDENGPGRLGQLGKGAIAPFAVDQIRVRIDRVDPVTLAAELSRRRVPEPLARP